MDAPDYLVIGHVTRDVVPGGFRQGGTSTYAALTARALGYRVAVLTSAAGDMHLEETLPGIELCVVPAAQSTTFENIYYDGHRAQYLRSQATVLTAEHLPPAWRRARIVHLGPVAQEVDPALIDAFPPETLVGVTPQGWLRRWDADGRVGFQEWAGAASLLARVAAMVMSLEDVGGDEAQLQRYVRMARLAVVTQSWQGAILYGEGGSEAFPAYRVPEVDPTGAGDVFAATFYIALAETGDARAAARFANAAASFAVEGPGVSTIAGRAAIEERLRKGVLRQ